jgi:pilus assembly protein CpaF
MTAALQTPLPTDVVQRVRQRLVAEAASSSPGRVAAALRAEGVVLGDAELLPLARDIHEAIAGLGPLSGLVTDARVTDVVVNGPDSVWVDRGAGLEQVDVRFRSSDELREFARRLAERAGRRLDDSHPWVDARLPEGIRLHAVLPPISVGPTLVSLRIPARAPLSIDDLVARGTLDHMGARWLLHIVRNRLSIIVSGGTGSGKTTVLGALLALVPAVERIVICEDTTELNPRHPHVVRLEAREPNIEGVGAVTLRDLVRQSLRMRPDRLIVGETRGVEVVDLLAALNTGHEGGAATTHANSAADVPARLEALALMAGLPRPAIHAQLAAGLHVAVHLDRFQGRRVVESINVFDRNAAGEVSTVPALIHDDGAFRAGPALPQLRRLVGV